MQLKKIFDIFIQKKCVPEETLHEPLLEQIIPFIEHYLLSMNARTETSNNNDITLRSALKNYFVHEIYFTKQVDLIYDLRYVILNGIKSVEGEIKSSLKYYHSVLHLLSLINDNENCKGDDLFSYLREWLNTNFKTDSFEINFMRGNFDLIKEKFPNNNQIIDELLNENNIEERNKNNDNNEDGIIGQINTSQKILKEPSSRRLQEWLAKHKKSLPKSLTVHSSTKNVFWGDYLCYMLLKDRSLTLSDVKNFIYEDNIFMKILTKDFQGMFLGADRLLQLMLIFTLPRNIIKDKYELAESLFISLGYKISQTNLFYSLELFKFTRQIDYFYNFIINNIEIDDTSANLLYNFAKTNILNPLLPIETLINSYLSTDNFMMAMNTIKFYTHFKFKLEFNQKKIINFCVYNFHQIREILIKLEIDELDRNFIFTLYKVINDEELNECDIDRILDHRINVRLYIDIVISKICETSLKDEIILKMLSILVEMSNEGCDVKKYREMALGKFYEINK